MPIVVEYGQCGVRFFFVHGDQPEATSEYEATRSSANQIAKRQSEPGSGTKNPTYHGLTLLRSFWLECAFLNTY